jgi:hypothetical protein
LQKGLEENSSEPSTENRTGHSVPSSKPAIGPAPLAEAGLTTSLPSGIL